MYVAVPMKKTWEVDLVKPLRSFIAETYGGGGPCSSPGDGDDDHSASLTEFNQLRNNAIATSVDKDDSALDVLYRCVTLMFIAPVYPSAFLLVWDRFSVEIY